jgi:hypothetical protein
MLQTVAAAPRNSLILVMDRSVGVIPETLAGGLVSATPTCVAVGTLSEHDGETTISLSDEGPQSGFGANPKFDGVMKTPSKTLSVCSVPDEVLLEMPVSSDETRVQIWANDPLEPDAIAIVALR